MRGGGWGLLKYGKMKTLIISKGVCGNRKTKSLFAIDSIIASVFNSFWYLINPGWKVTFYHNSKNAKSSCFIVTLIYVLVEMQWL